MQQVMSTSRGDLNTRSISSFFNFFENLEGANGKEAAWIITSLLLFITSTSSIKNIILIALFFNVGIKWSLHRVSARLHHHPNHSSASSACSLLPCAMLTTARACSSIFFVASLHVMDSLLFSFPSKQWESSHPAGTAKRKKCDSDVCFRHGQPIIHASFFTMICYTRLTLRTCTVHEAVFFYSYTKQLKQGATISIETWAIVYRQRV